MPDIVAGKWILAQEIAEVLFCAKILEDPIGPGPFLVLPVSAKGVENEGNLEFTPECRTTFAGSAK